MSKLPDHVIIDDLKARIRELETMLGQNDRELAPVFDLPPNLCKLLGLLMRVEVVTPEMIELRLNIATDAKVAAFRLRKRMWPFGVIIHSQYGIGYWLTPENKTLVKKIVKERQERVQEQINIPPPEQLPLQPSSRLAQLWGE